MKSEEILDAEVEYLINAGQDVYEAAQGCVAFGSGAVWAIQKIGERLEAIMGGLWNEDVGDGSLWIGGSALAQLKSLCVIDEEPPSVDEGLL